MVIRYGATKFAEVLPIPKVKVVNDNDVLFGIVSYPTSLIDSRSIRNNYLLHLVEPPCFDVEKLSN